MGISTIRNKNKKIKVAEFRTELGFDFEFGILCHENIKENTA